MHGTTVKIFRTVYSFTPNTTDYFQFLYRRFAVSLEEPKILV